MNAQARLGAFVLVTFVIFALFSSKIGGFQWAEVEGSSIDVIFTDASGISIQTPVLMAGVQVGDVASIVLKDNQALVTLRIQPDIHLPASTRAHIAGGGLVGEKYIALRATPGDKEPLVESMIPSSSGGNFRDMISRAAELTDDATRFFSKAERITDTVGAMIDENREDILATTHGMAQLIEENRPDIRSTTRGISGMVKDNRKHVDQLMRSLPQAADAGKNFFTEGAAAMHDLRELIIDNRENLYRTLFELRLASENLEAFSDDIRRNPWKMLKEKPEIKADRRTRQRRMEEMLMTTGRMGIAP
ncbi:MAG: MlaD family protein, partial [Mariprofundus sp.]|nr:MlaD family protein [Mariprofundus sp.]